MIGAALAAVHLFGGGLPGPPLLAWYADDLGCLPLVLSLVLLVQRLVRRSVGWTLPPLQALAGLAIYAVFFEGILPRLDTRAVADPWDVAAYAAGTVFFLTVINRPDGTEN